MADYYPLIARAVAGLQSSTPEARSAIYQRARNALIGQLRRLDPPIPESDVERESAALELAIARLEAELAPSPEIEQITETRVEARIEYAVPAPPAETGAPAPSEAQPPLAEAPPSEAPHLAEEPREEAQGAPPASPVAEPPATEAAAGGQGASSPTARPQPAPPPAFFKLRRDKPALSTPPGRPDGFAARRTPGSAPGASPTARPPFFPPPPGSAPVAEDFGSRPVPPSSPAAGEPRTQAPPPEPESHEPIIRGVGFEESSPRDFGAGDTAPEEWLGNTEPDVNADGSAGEAGAGESAGSRRIFPSLAKPRPEGQRPFAPQPPRDDAAPRRLWIVGFVVGMLVLLVAVVAFQLRDRPEDLRQKAAAPVIAPEAGANGKIVDRVGVGSDGAPAAPSAGNAPAQDDAAAKSAAPADETASSGGRAALLVQAPEEASKVRTFLGSVVWKVDNVSNGPGDPLSMAVRAEIDIPEEKLQTVVTLQKNFDGGLPASHTMKIQFNEAADSPLGAIQQINVPQMRRENTATGDGLSGVPVAITDNSFLVGLTRGNAEANNLDLLTSREWIDVPMVLSDGKIAKLTFEKGSTGDRAIADALAAWKAQ